MEITAMKRESHLAELKAVWKWAVLRFIHSIGVACMLLPELLNIFLFINSIKLSTIKRREHSLRFLPDEYLISNLSSCFFLFPVECSVDILNHTSLYLYSSCTPVYVTVLFQQKKRYVIQSLWIDDCCSHLREL